MKKETLKHIGVTILFLALWSIALFPPFLFVPMMIFSFFPNDGNVFKNTVQFWKEKYSNYHKVY